MNRSLVCLSLLVLLALGAARPPTAAEPSAIPRYIGTAHMSAEGKIVLHLRASSGGTVGHSIMTYAPDNPQYRAILDHVGPLAPGGTVSVKPWPAKP
jgi:hypothetical protein